MKKLLLMAVLLGGGMAAQASIKKDTTIIEFNDKATKNSVKVIYNTNKAIELPMKLSLESVLKAVGVDSNERDRAFVMISKGGAKRDTLLLFSHEGQRIKIITKNLISKKDTTIKGLIDTETKDTIEDEIETYVEENENYKQEDHPNKRDKVSKAKKFFSRSDFAIYLGLNNFAKSPPVSSNQLFGLRPWQSRYLAFSLRKNATLIKGNKVDVAFSYGPEIAWYNFMLQNSNLAKYNSGQVSFVENIIETKKSKLVMPYFNFPVLLNFGFKEDKFKIGFGGYAGYRLGGYSKEKYIIRRGDNKVKASFGFSDVIYGLTTEIGKKNGLTVFARYDLNKLFKSNQIYAQDLQAFSIGFRL